MKEPCAPDGLDGDSVELQFEPAFHFRRLFRDDPDFGNDIAGPVHDDRNPGIVDLGGKAGQKDGKDGGK